MSVAEVFWAPFSNMSNPVAHHPVEGSLEVPKAPVDPAWIRLIAADQAIQEQARQMVNIQTSIENVSKMVSRLSEIQKEENTQWSSEPGV